MKIRFFRQGTASCVLVDMPNLAPTRRGLKRRGSRNFPFREMGNGDGSKPIFLHMNYDILGSKHPFAIYFEGTIMGARVLTHSQNMVKLKKRWFPPDVREKNGE